MTKRQRRKWAHQEQQALAKQVSKVIGVLAETLREDFEGRRLYVSSMPKETRYRLYQFWIWKQRYKVSIRWMLNVLLPVYHKRMQKIVPGKGSNSLGVRIPTLTGKKSGEIIEMAVDNFFPSGGNYTEELQERRRQLVADRTEGDDEDFVVRRKELQDFPTPEAYAKYYARRIKRSRKATAKVVKTLEKNPKPYRGNPFA